MNLKDLIFYIFVTPIWILALIIRKFRGDEMIPHKFNRNIETGDCAICGRTKDARIHRRERR